MEDKFYGNTTRELCRKQKTNLGEEKNLERAKQKKHLDQKQKSWLKQINSAIKEFEALPEGDLAAMANWYETYNY